MLQNLHGICRLHGDKDWGERAHIVMQGDVVSDPDLCRSLGEHSHVITSPPYINAQDYYRNSKLELFTLEGLLPFDVSSIRDRFVGTDRGLLLSGIDLKTQAYFREVVPNIDIVEAKSRRGAQVVLRYFYDMNCAFDNVSQALVDGGGLVIVCGDNVVAGVHIRTWEIISALLEGKGFVLGKRFSDRIERRYLAPRRCGHKAIIKEEVVSQFILRRSGRGKDGRRESE